MDQSSETGLRLSTTLLLLGKNTQLSKKIITGMKPRIYWRAIDKILRRSSTFGTFASKRDRYGCFNFFYLVDCRSKDSRYDDMGHLESNNNKPMDKPLNLETKSERRLSSTDKDSGNTHYVLALSLCAKLNINLFFFLLIRDDKF